MKLFNKFKRDDKGAVAVETVMIMPLLLALVFGAIDISLNVYTTQKMAAATKSGIQYVVRGGRTEETIKNIVQDSFGKDIDFNDITVQAFCGCISESETPLSDEDNSPSDNGANNTPEFAGVYVKFETQLSDNMCTAGCSSDQEISALVNIEFQQEVRGILRARNAHSKLQTRIR